MPDRGISGIELAEFEVLMLIKAFPPEHLQRILKEEGVATLEQLDCLTLRNFLHYLRSL
ncbi:hypothetical protein Desti_5432 [Desulfomonile tiedjei DSM 6799]|uniref:Uncharacterized protein n=1 Tax=Desulfomonile tiedjei (strain ATCC 49306 / DSM 6799 / DCB-1) TaxID=706587 RepID=I4CEM8_DESTA|nr:hypothetical protein Desti_5432 [Desulfomonile tiedjei DSM 6799]